MAIPMSFKTILTATVAALVLVSCDQTKEQLKQIEALETRLKTQYTPERSDSLVTLYRDLVKAHPDHTGDNLAYLTRAAEIQFTLRGDGVSAVRWLDDALAHYNEGQDLTKPVTMLARIWNGYTYKTSSTYKMDPKDLTRMREHLEQHLPLLDSALIRMDRQMNVNGVVSDLKMAEKFIEVSEAYSSLTQNADKYAELIFRAAGLAQSTGQHNKALQLYYKITDNHPAHPKANMAAFMQGFIYENNLNNIEKAREAYQRFLEKYPNDPDYADDVKVALSSLGKSPEAMIKDFQKTQPAGAK